MELYLDTANVAEVERLARVSAQASPPIRASLPPAVSQSGRCCRACKRHGPKGRLFAQTMSRDAEGMVAEAKRLSNAIPDIVVKIPVTARAYRH